MNSYIQQLLTNGESHAVEFKVAKRQLNRNIYETICAFLNRDGGDILLGVNNDGRVEGIDRDCVGRMKQDFVTAINNPQKLNPPCYLSLQEVQYDDATLLHLSVPPSSQVHRCNSKIYDRNEDGDFDITNNQTLVTQLYIRKQSHYSENTIYPYAELADLNPSLLERTRKLAGVQHTNHPWLIMNDEELLKSAQLWQRDYQRDQYGLTLAAILMFGKDSTILSVLPHHRTDAILRRDDIDRYDDRDDIRTNLLDSHIRLLAFGEKHLKDPFYLEGEQRVSLRSHILREIVGNLLIHREYSHAFPAKLVIEGERLFTENSNRPHGHGPIDPKLFSPFPKNPVIARIFKEIGLADELGSGVRKLYKYGKAYGGFDPELVEDDIFRIILPFSEGARLDSKVTPENTQERIIFELEINPLLTIAELAQITSKSNSAIERAISKLKTEGRLSRIGPDKGGQWKVQVEKTPEKTPEKTLGKTLEETPEKTQERIIFELANNPLLTIAELAQITDKSDSAVERAISKLKTEGRLSRIGPDKGGQWKVQVEKTPEKTPGETLGETPEKTQERIIFELVNNPLLTIAELAQITGKSSSAIERAISKLKTEGRLGRIGPDKGGHWKVLK